MRQDAYWQAITIIEAQEILIQLRIADYPDMKPESRKKTHREFHRMAYPRTHDSSEVMTTEQLARKISAAING